jgi:hypothetical protein
MHTGLTINLFLHQFQNMLYHYWLYKPENPAAAVV